MVASFAPTPLYPLYQDVWQLSEMQIALAFASYPAGVLAVLLLLGGLSDRIGRRTTLFIGMALLGIAMVALSLAPSFELLLLGRLVHGFGSGLATGAAAALLMEAHPGGLSAGAFLNTVCIASGIAVGPFLSGGLAELTDRPLLFPYLVIGAALVVPLALLLLSPRSSPAIGRVRLIQPIGVPRPLLLPFSVAAAAIATANLGMSLFGSFGAEIIATVGWHSHAATGWFISSVLVLLALAQFIGRRFAHTRTMSVGVVGAALGWTLTAIGSHLEAAPLLVTGSLIVGTASGLCLLGSAGFIAAISPPLRRAEIYSAYLVVAFSMLGLVALGAGPIITEYSIGLVLALGAVLSTVFASWVLLQVARQRRG